MDPEAGPSASGPQRPKPARTNSGFRNFFARGQPTRSLPEIRRVDEPGEVPTDPNTAARSTPQLESTEEQPELEESAADGTAPSRQPSQPEASGSGTRLSAERQRSRQDSGHSESHGPNLRFNLPADKEVKRYDLEE